MKKKNSKKKNQGNRFLKSIISVYWILFCTLSPFLISLSPIVLSLIFNELDWHWLMFLTIPIGISLGLKMSDVEFMGKYVTS